jgi:signal transduction histidine kinase
MKKTASFIVLVKLLLCSLLAHLQSHSQQAADKREIGLLTIPELLERLKTAPSKHQAEILFWSSWKYISSLKVDSARFYCNQLKQLAGRSSFEADMGRYYLVNGLISLFTSNFTESAEQLNRSQAIFSRHNDLLLSGMACRYLALYYLMSDFKESNQANARKNYSASIASLRMIKGETGMQELIRTCHDFGRYFSDTYEIDSASYYLHSCLALSEKLGNALYLFNAAYELGELYLNVNDLDKSSLYLKKALDASTLKTDIIMMRKCLALYAQCLVQQRRYNEANQIIERYSTLNQKFGDAWGMIMLNDIKGCYELKKGNEAAAVAYFRKAYGRLDEMQRNWPDITNVTFHLSQAELKAGYYDSAVHHLLQTLVLSSQLQSGFNKKMDTYLLLSTAWEKKKNMDSAYYFYRIYTQIKDSLLSLQKQKVMMDLTTKYEAEKKEQKIKLLQNETDLYGLQLEKQKILDLQQSQKMSMLLQQNEISRLQISEKTLAFENQQKETARSQKESALLAKEKELQAAIASRENQRKRFAYGAIAIIFLCGCFVVFRSMQNKRLSKQLASSLRELKQTQEQLIQAEKEKEAENIRYRISRDIHDEVGATLSGVALFSEIAKQKMEAHNEQDAKLYLEHISANSKEMVEKMSEIVWAINPENDSFERIVSRLQAYALNLCGGKNIRLHTDVDEGVLDHHPEMNIRKNMYLIIKEAINNAVKYSAGKNLIFSLQKQNGHIVAMIKDDGKGFDIQTANTGNGMNNMRSRAVELNGTFDVFSQPGNGTEVRLEFNFHPNRGHRKVV